MKYEPLKGKTLLWNQITGDIETTDGKYFLETKTEDAKFFRIFLKKDVKSAVQGLLEEIERKKGDVDASLSKILKGEKKDTAVNRGALYGWGEALFWVKKLVKKWFPDAVEEADADE